MSATGAVGANNFSILPGRSLEALSALKACMSYQVLWTRRANNFHWDLTLELTRRRPELSADNKPDPGGRVE